MFLGHQQPRKIFSDLINLGTNEEDFELTDLA